MSAASHSNIELVHHKATHLLFRLKGIPQLIIEHIITVNMVLDIVAIVTPATGKEARVEEIIKDLSAKVKQNEPDVAKYMSYKTQSAEGATEYVFVERYVALFPSTSQAPSGKEDH